MEATESVLTSFEAPLRVKKSKAGSTAFITVPYFIVEGYGMKSGDLLALKVTKITKPLGGKRD